MRLGRLLGPAISVAIMLSIAGLSQVPLALEPADVSLIRLSWRARGERQRQCRPPSEEERRQLPPHMLQAEICEGRIAPYALEVVLDGATLLRDTVRGSGARQDRPLYVYRELRVEPGDHTLRVDFRRIGHGEEERPGTTEAGGAVGGTAGAEEAEAAGAEAARAEAADRPAVPDRLVLSERIRPAGGDVILVTYDSESRRLVVSEPANSPR